VCDQARVIADAARLRRIERPRYGYYLDNSIDCISQLLLAFGIGLSGYVRFDLCLFALVAYLMVSSFRGLAVPLMVSQNLSPKLDLQIDSIVDIMVDGIAG